mgnify:CR=1 FL=1
MVVVGAGPAGLTAAAELTGAGFEVIVLEQDEHYVGGLARTVGHRGFRFDIGGHRFFSTNEEIVRWWHRRLPEDFLRVRRQSRILYQRRLYDYPLRAANTLRNLGLCSSTACVLSYLWARCCPTRPELTFEEWVTNRFGRRLFNIFFKTYTERVWGLPCSEISADWASQRIKGLSLKDVLLHALRGQRRDGVVIKTLLEEFQYPRLGPGMMWERTREDLEHGGVRIYMGRKVQEIRRDGGLVRSVRTHSRAEGAEDWPADAFIVSMPLREVVLGMRPRMSEAVEAAARALQYRDFITVALIVRGEQLFPDNWIYVHDPDVHVARVQNFNNWSRAMVPEAGVTCLGLEYFCTAGDALWERSDAALAELASREAVQIGLVPAGAVRDARVVRMEKAYPVYDRGYAERVQVIREALAGIENLQSVGRNGMHKYNNQDHSMLTGLLAARNLNLGAFNLWNVNTDAQYQEAGCGTGEGRARGSQRRGR